MNVAHKHLSINFVSSFIYGASDRDSRNRLWNELSTSFLSILDHKPWILLGDFNIVKNTSEKKGGLSVKEHTLGPNLFLINNRSTFSCRIVFTFFREY